MELFSGIFLLVMICGFLYAAIIDAEAYAPAILVMSIICGLIAFITDHFVLAVCYICLSVFANGSMKKHPNGKDGQMKDSTLDRVKYAMVHFYDWERHEPYDMQYVMSNPTRHSDYYAFFLDVRELINPMMEKVSLVLYDAQHQIIPLDQYDYTWDELPYNLSSDPDDGGAYLNIKRKKAA